MASPSQTAGPSGVTSPQIRRLTVNRSQTAPEKMAVNGHFASVRQNGTANFENGVQVIDEEKEFKYVLPVPDYSQTMLTGAAPIYRNTCNMPTLPVAASTIMSSQCSVPSRPASPPYLMPCLIPISASCPRQKGGRRRREYGCPRTNRHRPKWLTTFS